jgi:hypothetical protein
MFKRRQARDEAWEGVVTGKKRSSPDGQIRPVKIRPVWIS